MRPFPSPRLGPEGTSVGSGFGLPIQDWATGSNSAVLADASVCGCGSRWLRESRAARRNGSMPDIGTW